MSTLAISIVIISSLAYAWLSRMCGGAPPKLPLGLDQWLYAIPYGVVGFLTGGYIWAAVAYATAFIGKRTGHGQYFDLGLNKIPPGDNVEKVDFIVRLLYGKDEGGNFWRDLFGLTLTGVLVSIGAGVGLIFNSHYILGAVILLTGAAKGLAYVIGHKLPTIPIPWFDEATAVGELLTGLFAGLGLAFTIITLL